MKQTQSISCDQCEAAMINGVFCHETGCPNSKKVWKDGEWVRYFECHECGCDVREGESCDCQEPETLADVWIAAAGHSDCEACIRIAAQSKEDCVSALEEAMAEEIQRCEDQDAQDLPEGEESNEITMWFVGPFHESPDDLTDAEIVELGRCGVAHLEC